MTKKPKRLLTVAIIGSAFGGLIVIATVKAARPILDWGGRAVSTLWRSLSVPITLPFWLAGVLGAIAISALALWFLVLRETRRVPTYKNYKRDYLLNVVWRWDWERSGVVSPWCFCPVCDTVLVYASGWGYEHNDQKWVTKLFCETCSTRRGQHDGDRNDLVNRALRQIDRKLRSGEWKKVVEHQLALERKSN